MYRILFHALYAQIYYILFMTLFFLRPTMADQYDKLSWKGKLIKNIV